MMFNPEKATKIIDYLEELFPENEQDAALHTCAVLLGLCPNNDTARAALEFVISQAQKQ